MNTYIINSPKDLDQHRDEFWVHIKGNVEIKTCLWLSELPKRLSVDWNIVAKSWSYVEAGESIKAGDNYWMLAWLSITCKKDLKAWLNVFAGTCSRREISDEEKTITCWRFEWWEVAYWILK